MEAVVFEATVHEGLPPVLMGIFALVCLLGILGWVIGMGSGRPNTK